jgi:hypothetical protein
MIKKFKKKFTDQNFLHLSDYEFKLVLKKSVLQKTFKND